MNDKSKIVIRKFQKGDEIGVCQAHVRSVREVCSKDYTAEEIEAWIGKRQPQDYLDAIDRGEHFWVIEVNNVIAGFGTWIEDRILGFYMHPEYVGRGLAKQFFKKVEQDYLQGSGHKKCFINSTLTAKPFYERMGFVPVKRSKHTLKSGSQVDIWEMIKNY